MVRRLGCPAQQPNLTFHSSRQRQGQGCLPSDHRGVSSIVDFSDRRAGKSALSNYTCELVLMFSTGTSCSQQRNTGRLLPSCPNRKVHQARPRWIPNLEPQERLPPQEIRWHQVSCQGSRRCSLRPEPQRSDCQGVGDTDVLML
jgi:hypothetical protein